MKYKQINNKFVLANNPKIHMVMADLKNIKMFNKNLEIVFEADIQRIVKAVNGWDELVDMLKEIADGKIVLPSEIKSLIKKAEQK